MNSFGKYFFLRLVTAVTFGLIFAQAVRVYQLFDFGFAAEIGFVFVLLGFMFLSQKYTLFMQVMALLCALYVGYRLQTPPKPTPPLSAEFIRARKLFLQVIRYNLEGDRSLPMAKQQALQFCQQSDCPKFLQEAGPADFWFFEEVHNTGDKPFELWYINDHLQLFTWNSHQLTSLNPQDLLPNEGKGTL